MTWEPDRYLQFSDERLRPALDLLGHIPPIRPAHVVDLGCGAGNVTHLLAERWPNAELVGLDSSPEMLERARNALPSARFELTGVEQWDSEDAPDLLFSNAALHWVGQHEALFPRLLDRLSPGGVLAVQMPGNFDAPSHRLIRELAASPIWSGKVGAGRMGNILGMADYHRLLAPRSTRLSLWETTYWQALHGASPVLDWLRGTTLLPYVAPMDEATREAFFGELGTLLADAYPADENGTTLFPFRRIFIVAQR
ncbi:MAG: methyltransferase domain-containing protein [Rhodocyclaceae bacterium]|nr:MAG: methyltransferase domain-containing protein [Rhodocyclaceae bacterium]